MCWNSVDDDGSGIVNILTAMETTQSRACHRRRQLLGMMGARRILGPVKKNKRRRCLSCQKLFYPHPRTRRLQKYCAEPQCRAASKKASQQRWLQKPENRDYFRGPQHVSRVQAWREEHLDQGQKRSKTGRSLQETIMGQRVDRNEKSSALELQEMIEVQPMESVPENGFLVLSALQDSM